MERFEAGDLGKLFEAFQVNDYTLIGPTLRDQAIVYDQISSPEQLPRGYTEEQEAGTYRLRRRDDEAYFGFSSSPQSWKQFLFPPRERLFRASRESSGQLKFESQMPPKEKFAFLGVRACDLAAIAIQDRVFTRGEVVDPAYQARRRNALLVAVQCSSSAPTCFCASMKTGPEVKTPFDLKLVEVVAPQKHYFLIESGSEHGAQVIESLRQKGALTRPDSHDLLQSELQFKQAAGQQHRAIEPLETKDLLARNFENPHWEEIGTRCLSCANCTLVCPTCFCSTVEDVADLSGDHAERWRRWDSCFTLDHSYLHGGSVRKSVHSRYRQWLTHKLSSWWEQFQSSGCVGCGRCVTWCPVGIDLTEEVKRIKLNEKN